ncbi:MAG TPA: HPF/RaiA family ribosome-associated protein [Blastocatellia bacterium]|nr:HPF/RaiA family ribosome-associated protein [Blastocatellia bacterium]
MQIQTQITWRGTAPSPALGAKIHEEAAKLEEFYGRITSCRVMIEIPHQHRFHIRIGLTLPGDEIVVNREPTSHSSLQRTEGAVEQELASPHEDIYVAVRDAFKTARRQVQEYAQRRNGAVKHHKTYAQKNLYNN